jgi:hypothetical protein
VGGTHRRVSGSDDWHAVGHISSVKLAGSADAHAGYRIEAYFGIPNRMLHVRWSLFDLLEDNRLWPAPAQELVLQRMAHCFLRLTTGSRSGRTLRRW